jgi:predicted nicotinamide N-methyase
VVGIAAALAGAGRVICCDRDPLAREAAAANARRNGVRLELAAALDAVGGAVDLLCAADLFYDPANLVLAEHFLDRAALVLIADSRVPRFAAAGYAQVAAGRGVTEPDLGEPESVKQVRLYRGRGRPAPQTAARGPAP